MKYELKEDLMIRNLQSRGAIVDFSSGTYFSTNEVGQFILECLSQGLSNDEIFRKALNHFEVSENEFRKDFEDYIAELKKSDLLSS